MSETSVAPPSPDPAEAPAPGSVDWPALVADLNRLLRLRTTPIGMKLFETVEEMKAVPRVRRPSAVHTMDQIVAQAARLSWTVGITAEDLAGPQCVLLYPLGRKNTQTVGLLDLAYRFRHDLVPLFQGTLLDTHQGNDTEVIVEPGINDQCL